MSNLVKSVALIAVICLAVVAADPLDDYVNKPDPTYKWEPVNSVRGVNYTAYNIKLTSQTWMSPADVSISVWTHWLQICVPDYVRNFSSDSFRNSSFPSLLSLHRCSIQYSASFIPHLGTGLELAFTHAGQKTAILVFAHF